MHRRYGALALVTMASVACGTSSDPDGETTTASATGGGTTTSSSAAGGSGGVGASTSATTGGQGGIGGALGYDALAFEVVELELPEWIGTTRELVLLEDAAAFEAYFGVASPAAIDWSTEDALLYTEGALPFPGHLATVQGLALREDGGELRVDTQLRTPGTGCETIAWEPPAYQLVTFPALSSPPAVAEEASTTSFDCSVAGAAANATCDPTMLCGPDLVCSSLTRFSPGTCQPLSHYGAFVQDAPLAIPDDNPTGTESTLVVSDLATVDTDVVVHVTLAHPQWSPAHHHVDEPRRQRSLRVAAGDGALGVHHHLPGAGRVSGDESVNGTWTLRVSDATAGQSGSVVSWQLAIVSRLD